MPVPLLKHISDVTKIYFNHYVLLKYKNVKNIISDVLGKEENIFAIMKK